MESEDYCITGNVKFERPPIFLLTYEACGTDVWIMQVRDCHWFRLNESPTNMICCPLNLIRNSLPLNLKKMKSTKSIKFYSVQMMTKSKITHFHELQEQKRSKKTNTMNGGIAFWSYLLPYTVQISLGMSESLT